MKYYTVTGKSTEKPEGLPDGFEVEETDDGVTRIGATHDGDVYTIELSKDGPGLKLFLPRSVEIDGGRRLFIGRSQGVKLRDAVTELLDEPAKPKAPAVVNHGDPEPPRHAVYIARDGATWSYEGSGWTSYDGGTPRAWSEESALFNDDFPLRIKTA